MCAPENPSTAANRDMNRKELVNIFVLEAVADDYENVEQIHKEVTGLASRCGLTINVSEIEEAMTDLIKSDLVRAYRLSPRLPAEEINGVPVPSIRSECYFWATPKGREFLASPSVPWPFDEEGFLRKDWFPPGA